MKMALKRTEMAVETSFDAFETYYIRSSKNVPEGVSVALTNANCSQLVEIE